MREYIEEIVNDFEEYIDIRDRYLHDLVTKGIIELRHVRSEDNTSDINSKNTAVEIHQYLADKMYEGIPLVHVDPNEEDVALDTAEASGS